MRDVIERARPLWSRRLWQSRLVLWGFASMIGVLAVGFARLADNAQSLFRSLMVSPWHLALPPVSFGIIAWLTRRWFRGAEGSGIPQTIYALREEASAASGRILSMRVIIARILLTSIGLASGASVGREGPTVHLGAAILNAAGRWMPRASHAISHRTLILAGGAAGIAAAFNTPLAGVVFAIEELSRSFEERTSGTAVAAVVLSGVTAIALAGNYSYFGTPILASESGVSIAMLAIALAGGVFGGLFSRLLLAGTRGLPGVAGRIQTQRPVVFAICCGLMVALAGWCSAGQTFGTGYAEARDAIEGHAVLSWQYAPLRALAVLASLLSGIPGGLFAPSLSVGAGVGQSIATLLGEPGSPMWPVLGMCAYLAGVTQAPLTSFVIVLEMTAGHSVALPLMLTAAIGAATSRLLAPSLYRTLAERYVFVADRRIEHL